MIARDIQLFQLNKLKSCFNVLRASIHLTTQRARHVKQPSSYHLISSVVVVVVVELSKQANEEET